jgi:hypothetical protein
LPADGISSATSAVFSADASRLYFTEAQSGRVSIYSLAGDAAPLVLNCNCRPAGLVRMGSAEVYRLNEYSGEPLRMLDGAAAPPRIVMIPPALDADKEK